MSVYVRLPPSARVAAAPVTFARKPHCILDVAGVEVPAVLGGADAVAATAAQARHDDVIAILVALKIDGACMAVLAALVMRLAARVRTRAFLRRHGVCVASPLAPLLAGTPAGATEVAADAAAATSAIGPEGGRDLSGRTDGGGDGGDDLGRGVDRRANENAESRLSDTPIGQDRQRKT